MATKENEHEKAFVSKPRALDEEVFVVDHEDVGVMVKNMLGFFSKLKIDRTLTFHQQI